MSKECVCVCAVCAKSEERTSPTFRTPQRWTPNEDILFFWAGNYTDIPITCADRYIRKKETIRAGSGSVACIEIECFSSSSLLLLFVMRTNYPSICSVWPKRCRIKRGKKASVRTDDASNENSIVCAEDCTHTQNQQTIYMCVWCIMMPNQYQITDSLSENPISLTKRREGEMSGRGKNPERKKKAKEKCERRKRMERTEESTKKVK